MAETCFVCNKKIGLLGTLLTTVLSLGTTGIHYRCRSKYNNNPEKYIVPSTVVPSAKEAEINITAPYTPEKSIERNRYLTAPDSAPIATLNAVANTVLCISIICGFILVFQAFYGDNRWTYLIGLGIFFCGLVQWATIKVFSDIAEDIRNIRMDISRSTLKSMSQTANKLSE